MFEIFVGMMKVGCFMPRMREENERMYIPGEKGRERKRVID
jgi:hypothetical protein